MMKHIFRTVNQFNRFKYNFSNTSRQYDFQDILIMKRLVEQDNQIFYQLHYQSNKMVFPQNITVHQFELELMQTLHDISNVKTYISTPKGEVEVSKATPFGLLAEQDFSMRFNEEEKYIVLTKVDDPPVIDFQHTYPINQHSLYTHFEKVDQTQRTRIVLADLVSRMLIEIGKTDKPTLERSFILLLIKKVILKMGMYSQSQKQSLQAQVSYLQQKEIRLQNIQASVIKDLEAVEQRQLNFLYAYLIFQVAFTQYGTFAVWGWGVMEPITFLIGVSDMIIAYIFWMRTTKSFSYENILTVAVDRQIDRHLDEKFDYKDQLNDVSRMIEYLKFKQMIYSTNLDEVIDVIEGAIDGRQIKQQEQDEDDA